MTINEETIEIIDDLIRETEESLENLEESIALIRQFVFVIPYDFQIQHYINFFQGLNVEMYLENLRAVNRIVHTVKGTSAFVDLNKVNKYCHTAEELTLDISKGRLILTDKAFSLISKIPVILNRFIEIIKRDYSDSAADVDMEIEEIINLRKEMMEFMGERTIHLDEIRGKDYGRVRNSSKNLKISINLNEFDEIIHTFQAFIQDSQNILTSHDVDQNTIFTMRQEMTSHLDNLITASKSNIVLSRYPRIVKDLGYSLNKEINFNVIKNDAKARPDIWDKCHIALVHIVRNSIDHGIESSAEREKKSKPAAGSISMEIYEDFKNLYISVADDGRGIDPEIISEKCLSKGLIKPEELSRLSRDEKIRLIFKPGFSTRESATDISGRGVGMDAVIKEIETNLAGRVLIDTEQDKGTKFTLEIPKSETLSECILFGDGTYKYAIPLVSDIEFLECNSKYIKNVLGSAPLYTEGDLELPLLDLFTELHNKQHDPHNLPIIKIGTEKGQFGLIVPCIIGQERLNIDRNKKLKPICSLKEDIIFGYGLTDPITVVFDIDYLFKMTS